MQGLAFRCDSLRQCMVSVMSYCLDLLACMRQIHSVLHISLIKQYRSDGRTQPRPPPELEEDHPKWTVEQILGQDSQMWQPE